MPLGAGKPKARASAVKATLRLVTLVITRAVPGQPDEEGRERRIAAAVGLIRDQGDREKERNADSERRDP